jgi:hypothetical protein
MRDRIRKRLTEYRTEAMESIGIAVAKTTKTTREARTGNLNSGGFYLKVNEDNKSGFAEYMDRSIAFIRHVAPGSPAEYADELRDGANKLKQEIMERENSRTASLHEPTRLKLTGDLDVALDRLIKRKVEDFEFGIIEGREMNVTTNNTVNIINSNISNAVVEINQSGRDTISKETAKKLEQLVNSDDIKGLREQARLDVLDQVSDLIKELKGPTDAGKVHRGLKRLAGFISSVASSSMAEFVAQVAVAYATAKGLMP